MVASASAERAHVEHLDAARGDEIEVAADNLHRRIGPLVTEREVDAAPAEPRPEPIVEERVVVIAEHEHGRSPTEIEEPLVRSMDLLTPQRLPRRRRGGMEGRDDELIPGGVLPEVDADQALPRPVEDRVVERLLQLERRAADLFEPVFADIDGEGEHVAPGVLRKAQTADALRQADPIRLLDAERVELGLVRDEPGKLLFGTAVVEVVADRPDHDSNSTAYMLQTDDSATVRVMQELLDTPVTTINGEATTLAEHAGKVLLIVNVASRCGLAPQYEALEALQRKYADRGFTVLGFPSNQFLGQEPGTEAEIREYCSTTWGVTFPMFEKVKVNGPGAHPLYKQLRKTKDGNGLAGPVAWNFEKFLVAPDGTIQRFRPTTVPDDPAIIEAIEANLPN